MDTFTWIPAYGAQLSETPRVLSANFGNGKVAVAVDGINNNPQAWRLTFSQMDAVIENIRTFLRYHKSTVPFNWVNPLGESIQVVCSGWSITRGGPGVSTMQVDFQQFFGFAA